MLRGVREVKQVGRAVRGQWAPGVALGEGSGARERAGVDAAQRRPPGWLPWRGGACWSHACPARPRAPTAPSRSRLRHTQPWWFCGLLSFIRRPCCY